MSTVKKSLERLLMTDKRQTEDFLNRRRAAYPAIDIFIPNDSPLNPM
jgi:hypothetical protein